MSLQAKACACVEVSLLVLEDMSSVSRTLNHVVLLASQNLKYISCARCATVEESSVVHVVVMFSMT